MERTMQNKPEVCKGPLVNNCPQCLNAASCPHIEALAKYYSREHGLLLYARTHTYFTRHLQPHLVRYGDKVGAHTNAIVLYNFLNSYVYHTTDEPNKFGRIYMSYPKISELSGLPRDQIKRYTMFLTGSVPGLEFVNVVRKVHMQTSKTDGDYKTKTGWELLLYTHGDEILQAVNAYYATAGKDPLPPPPLEHTPDIITLHRVQGPTMVTGLDGPLQSNDTARGPVKTNGRRIIK